MATKVAFWERKTASAPLTKVKIGTRSAGAAWIPQSNLLTRAPKDLNIALELQQQRTL